MKFQPVIKPVVIGKLKIKNPLFLAPMVDVTDLPYRIICRKNIGMAYTEMLYVDAIIHENRKTKRLMKTNAEDRPIGIQITGSNIEHFKKAIPYLKSYDLVDLNCGCPSSRIVGNEAGSYLLNNPEKIAEIIKLLKKSGLVVTAKIRLGFKNNSAIEIAKIIEEAGADAITVHARLAVQGNDVPADWKWIKKVKNAVKIPVIGNGDILNGKQAKEMLSICDGVMIGRGAIGDPLIFSRILKYLETGIEEEFDFIENIKLFKEYLKICDENRMIDIARIKYIGTKFIRNVNGAAKLRQKIMGLKSFEEICKFANEITN